MQRLAGLGTGVLQDGLHVTQRVDERQVRQPSVGIDLFGALASVIILFSQILFCFQQCFRNKRETGVCM
jgi:hypothetical protein